MTIQISILKNKIFYGWWIVFSGVAILTLSSGIGFFGHALILDPLIKEFCWPKGDVSLAITLFFLVAAISGSIIGSKIDKYGPTPVLIFGSFCIGLGFLLLSRIHELWQLYVTYILIAIGWSGTSVIPISALITNWFLEKRGFALSVAMTGLSLGGIIIVPIASCLLNNLGFRVALPFFGFSFWAIVIPISLFIIKKEPSILGLFPDGRSSLANHRREVSTSIYSNQMVPWRWNQAMATKAFWSIVFAFCLVLGSQLSFMVHEVSFLTPLLGYSGAAMAVSLMTSVSFLGRLVVGSFVDRIDKRAVGIICFLLQGMAIFTIVRSNHPLIIYICVMVFGFTMGNIVMMQSLIISECFGKVSFGMISGLAMLFTTSGSAFGPLVTGVLFDLTNNYKTGFTILAFNYFVASIFFPFAKPPLRPKIFQNFI